MAAFIVGYGVGETGKAMFSRCCVFPILRTRPNDTHASLRKAYNENCFPKILANGVEQNEKAKLFFFDGILKAEIANDIMESRAF